MVTYRIIFGTLKIFRKEMNNISIIYLFTFTDYLINPTEHRFNFSKIKERETLTIISNLKSKNSSGKDEISNKVLKSIKYEISKPLTIIINQSL